MPITDFQKALKGETWRTLAPGERILFEGNELHGVKALEASYFLVTTCGFRLCPNSLVAPTHFGGYP